MNQPAYPLTPAKDDDQVWPAQGQWSFEDYLRLPDDGQRYEVLRGELYVTPAPAYDHQFPVTKLTSFLDVFVTERDLGVPFGGTLRRPLPGRLADPVEPDLVFFRKV